MAIFAQMSGPMVRTVNCVDDEVLGSAKFPESEPIGQAFLASLGLDGLWLQCSEDGSFRGAYPGPGWTYDAISDLFVPPIALEES